jgi:hypothetical protein
MIGGADELEPAFAGMKAGGIEAVLVQPSLPRAQAAELALRHRLPAIAPTGPFAALGGLAAYAPSQDEWGRRTAAIVDKILKAASRPTCRSSSRRVRAGDQPQDRARDRRRGAAGRAGPRRRTDRLEKIPSNPESAGRNFPVRPATSVPSSRQTIRRA